jgi:hypothetical protein
MLRILTLITIALLLALCCAGQVLAQAEQRPEKVLDEPLPEPDESEAAEELEAEEDDTSRETDFNEENFRRSMELRDRALQRSPDLTTGSYSSGTGLKSLEDLKVQRVCESVAPPRPAAAGATKSFTEIDEPGH